MTLQLKLLLLILILIVSATVFGKKYTAQLPTLFTPSPIKQPTTQPQPTIAKTSVVSGRKVSPDNNYIVKEGLLGDNQIIRVEDQYGKVITENLIFLNEDIIGYGTKFQCMCATYFRGWMNNERFVIYITNALEEEYEYEVDAKTAMIDEATFKQIK